ncbi:MAG: LysE family transporter [Bradymonadales bacterium]
MTFFKALLVGLTVAIPVGPAGLLCLERASSHGWRPGLSSVIGMNLADVLSALLVVLGVGFLSDFLTAHRSAFALLSGVVLLVVGGFFFWTRHRAPTTPASKDLAYHGLSTFLLAISPVTMLMMVMLFSTLGIEGFGQSLPVILLGVATGSVLWGVCLLFASKWLKALLGARSHILKTILASSFVLLGLYSTFLAIS